MARPTKLTVETQERIIEAIKLGNYAETAACYAGIHKATYYRWMERGECEEDGCYREFRDAVAQASAEAEVRAVKVIQDAMPTDHRAAMRYLERRFPSRWGNRSYEQVELTERPKIELRIVTRGELDAEKAAEATALVAKG